MGCVAQAQACPPPSIHLDAEQLTGLTLDYVYILSSVNISRNLWSSLIMIDSWQTGGLCVFVRLCKTAGNVDKKSARITPR